MLLSVLSIQGAAYLSQFILAGLLSAESFAIVRTVESALQLLSTIAPWGMSLLVVRLASQGNSDEESRRLLSSYMGLAGLTALLLAGVGSLVLVWANGKTVLSSYFAILIWIAVPVSLSRTALNYFYGREKFGLISVLTFATSALSLLVLVVLTQNWQLDGWVASRYVTELAILVVAIVFIREKIGSRFVAKAKAIEALAEGAAISLSLIFRSAIENVPFLILAYLTANQKEVAIYGLCTLLISGGMVLPASINSVLLPRYGSMLKNDSSKFSLLHVKYERYVVLSGVGVALLLIGLGFIMSFAFKEKYGALLPYLALAAFMVPIRAFTTINANVLFVNQKTATGTKINFIFAALTIPLTFYLYPGYGLWGVVAGSLAIEIGAAIMFKIYSIRSSGFP